MAVLTIDGLEELIGMTLGESLRITNIIALNTAWEKWFQCSLFAQMIMQGYDAQVEACMGDCNNNRYDFIVINDDGSAAIGELKCARANITLDESIEEFKHDIEKLRAEPINYCKFAILVIPVELYAEIRDYGYQERFDALPVYEEWSYDKIDYEDYIIFIGSRDMS